MTAEEQKRVGVDWQKRQELKSVHRYLVGLLQNGKGDADIQKAVALIQEALVLLSKKVTA